MARCWRFGEPVPRVDGRAVLDWRRKVTMPRTVEAEGLDRLAPDDPDAVRSRRDLRRVHRAMGTRSILVRGWQSLLLSQRPGTLLNVLELGAGDGSLLLGVARALAPAWPRVRLTLLDRQDIVGRDTLAAYAALGWTVSVEVADVQDWASPDAAAQTWDLVSTTLFLHHFEGRPLEALLAGVASRSDRFFACEPRRDWLALAGSHLVGVLGANAVTRVDAVLSVHAGFREQELTALWPGQANAWHTREAAAGPFSHCFSARRGELA